MRCFRRTRHQGPIKADCRLTGLAHVYVAEPHENEAVLDLPIVESPTTYLDKEAGMQSFKVSGMTCGHCVRAVTEAIKGVDTAAAVEVDLAGGRVTVQGGTASAARLAQAIAAEGYAAEPWAA